MIFMAVKIVCDFCNRPLEIEAASCVFYCAKRPIVRKRYKCLCRSCADKLNDIFDEEILSKTIDVRHKMIELNKMRREKLGTKG